MQYLLRRGARAAGLAGLIGALLGVVAAHPASAATTIPATPASTDPATCASPNMSQTFLSVKDRNWYTLAPGQSPEGFTGSGWTLADGAGIVTTQLQDGQSGSVLNLPSGAVAVSPPICVTSDYPTARTLVRNVVGGEGVQFYVSYAGDPAPGSSRRTPASSTASRATGPFRTRSTFSPTTTRPAGRSSDSRSSRAARPAISSSTTSTWIPV